MKKHLTLRQKLMWCCGALACVAVVAIASLPWLANRLSGELDRVANGPARKLDMLGQLLLVGDTARISGRNVLVYKFIDQPEIAKTENAKFLAAGKQVHETLAELRSLMDSDAEKSVFDRMATNVDTWLSMTEKVNETSMAGNPAEAAVSAQKNTRQYAQNYDKAKMDLLELQRREMRAAGLRMQSFRSWASWASAAGALLALIVGSLVVLVIRRLDRTLRIAISELVAGARNGIGQLADHVGKSGSGANCLRPGRWP